MKKLLLVLFSMFIPAFAFAVERGCHMSQSVQWALHPRPDQVAPQALSQEEIATLDQYAAHLVGMANGLGGQVHYDAAGLAVVNDMVSSIRPKIPESEKNRIAHLAGAFYGKAIISNYPMLSPAWVRADQQIGILLSKGSLKTIVFPISRAFKQLTDGDEYSMVVQFSALPEILCGPPK